MFKPSYKFKNLKRDIISGLSTATIALPQSMAYALILGVNPIYGIYASIFSMIVATIFNSSSYLIVGPTNMMAVAMYSSLTNFQGANYLEIILLTTFLIGLFQFLLVTFNLSELIKYVSHPVVVALTHGAAILILFSQITNFTGVEIQGSNVIFKSISFIQNIEGINYLNLAVGVLTLFSLWIINKINKKLPEYLITVILITIMTYLTGIYEQIPLVAELPNRIIDFNLVQFNFETIEQLYTIAFSIALLGLIQTMAVLQAISLKTNEEIDFDKEFRSQGITNMIISFFSGFAISTSFSRTFANLSAGAKTKLSQLFSALSIILFILFLRPFMSYIPVAVLAGLVIMAAFSIFDFEEIVLNMKTTTGDAVTFWSTFFATIILPKLDQAIYFGVIVSLIFVIRISKEANIDVLYYDKEDDEQEYHLQDEVEVGLSSQSAKIINLKGAIHFSAADDLKSKLEEYYEPNTDFIIRLREVERVDITIIKVFVEFIDDVQEGGSIIMFTGINERIHKIFDQFGITEKIGEENIYPPESTYLAATNKAIDSSRNGNNNKK